MASAGIHLPENATLHGLRSVSLEGKSGPGTNCLPKNRQRHLEPCRRHCCRPWIHVIFALLLLVRYSSAQDLEIDGVPEAGKISPAMRRFLADPTISPALQLDRAVLLAWRAHWLGYAAQNVNATAWLQKWNDKELTPCNWDGITCEMFEEQLRVTVINFTSRQLKGVLPATGYSNLTAVRSLIIAINDINGTIPEDLGEMPNLQILDLAQNRLQGGIPDQFGDLLEHLVSLNVSVNNISQPLPAMLFSSCAMLHTLNFSRNIIGGGLPHIGNCHQLEYIDLWKNHMVGAIPIELGLLPSLKKLVLSENYIGGPIPHQLFESCKSLQIVQLARMFLDGPLPLDLFNCPLVTIINIQSNNLSGSLPHEIGQLTNLVTLALGNNSLGGPLPEELGALANLKYVDFSLNQFEGTVPPEYSGLQSLRYLALQENRLTGPFPDVLTGLPQLRLLDLSNNRMVGDIPAAIFNVTTLTSLLLAVNNFTGSISPDLGYLVNLQVLDLSANSLTGSIPPTIGNLKQLLWLQLSNNRLSGSLPEEMGNCSSLIWLNLGWNDFSGPIPDSFEFIGSTALATFRYNWVNLPLIPAEMGECGALERWLPGDYAPYSFLVSDLAQQGRQCRVWWNLLLKGQLHPAELDTPLAYMQLSYNRFSGSLPNRVGQHGDFSILFLDHNQFTGPIPDLLDELPLYNANFSHNHFNGTVPESLGFIKQLLSLDLSYNELSGNLPPSLGNLTFLDRFNISYNNLSGPVPLVHQFATFPFSVYAGNPGLCYDGSPYASTSTKSQILPLCGELGSGSSWGPHYRSGKAGLSPATILGISIVSTLLVLVVVGIACYASTRRTYVRNENDTTSPDSRFSKVGRDRFHSSRDLLKIPVSSFGTDSLPKALAYVDLLVATNNFDDANIIGDGGFGVVYKAKLEDGSVVAIKKLIQDGAQGEREFAAEMLTLGNIRHDNLVTLLGYCASEREKLLLYKCMSNGSLDEWLHERPGGREVLSWSKRLNIAAGAARGLAFLHHSCAPVIIHRDMKASNILLDDDYNACVTDFGLARRMYGQDTHVSTIVAGTLGYVPPEYSQTWRSTTKGDVYSFGVVLLELITGKRPTGIDYDDESGMYTGGNLVEWVRILLANRRHEEAYDPIIKNSGASQELFQFLKLAVVCTEDIPSNRPAMNDVTRALDQIQISHNVRYPGAAFL